MAAPFRPGGRAASDERDLALTLSPDPIKAVLVSIAHGFAELRHGDELAGLVNGLADVFRHRLDRQQRGLILVAFAQAAEPTDLEALAEDVLGGAGPPVPPFYNIRAEAEDWAAFASKRQVRAILAACLALLPLGERLEILAAASRKVPA